MMKVFDWQAKNEKVLYLSRQNLLSFFIIELVSILTIIWVSVFIFLIWYFVFENLIISLLVSIFILILWFLYLFFTWYKTYFVVTNKRIIKFVRSWIFSQHMKEMKLDQINEKVARRRGVIETIFKIWNVKISWKDKENVIWFEWVKYPQEVVQYISRVIDYIKENQDYDYKTLKEFIPRKYRK